MSKFHRLHRAGWDRVRLAVLARDKRRCRTCNRPGKLEVHHVLPLAAGGTNDLANLTTICRNCHLLAHHPVDPDREAWATYLEEQST